MMIQPIKYKNMDAIRMENDVISLIIIPGLGGKIASFYYKKREFELVYQDEKDSYIRPKEDTRFGECNPSGIDDCFPTIDYDEPSFEKNHEYSDHGEIWRSVFDTKVKENYLILTFHSDKNHYDYQKKYELTSSGIRIQFQIKNTGKENFPCLYAWHGLVNYEEDMRLICPGEMEHITDISSQPQLPGNKRLCSRKEYDFTKVPPRNHITAMKYYMVESIKTGICGYDYPSKHLQFLIEFEEDKLPYLALWITTGQFHGAYNLAWEPTNAYYDSITKAHKNKKLPILKPQEEISFTIKLTAKEYEFG